MLHEAWSDGSFFPIINRSAAAMIEAGATLLWTVDAASWHEAMELYHTWQGWKAYVPMDDDPVAYTLVEEAEATRLMSGESTFNRYETNTSAHETNTDERET